MKGDSCAHEFDFAPPRRRLKKNDRLVFNPETDCWCDRDGNPVDIPTFFAGRSALGLLGVHGCRGIEDAVLAGLALGEPVLLIGSPGSAKTAMTERIAADMHLNFWAYDASKAMFEDIVGFPDPASLGRGEVRYVPTPLSLIGKQFILVDEVSRAHPALQNKWLEIIRSRRVMGMDLPALRTVFGAMNPAGLAGTVALDEALAGRFTFHVSVPEIGEMPQEDRHAVIQAADASPLDPLDKSSRLNWVVRAVCDRQPVVAERHGPRIVNYVDALSTYLAGKDWKLDGRRQGMILRGLVAYVAVREVFTGHDLDAAALGGVIRQGLDNLLPFRAMGRDLPRLAIDGAHQYALAAMAGNARQLPPSDLLAAAMQLVAGDVVVDDDQLSLLVSRTLQAFDHPSGNDDGIRAGAAMIVMATSVDAVRRLPLEARQRLIVAFSDTLDLEPEDVQEFIDETVKQKSDELRPEVFNVVQRVSYNLTKRSNSGRFTAGTDFGDVASSMARLVFEGGAA